MQSINLTHTHSVCISNKINNKEMAERIVNSVNGVTPATARKIAQFFFGESFVKMTENDRENTFDFFIDEIVIDSEIAKFKKFWGANFKVYKVKNEITEA